MKTPMLIALALTALMIAVHIGLFWWFVLRESRKMLVRGENLTGFKIQAGAEVVAGAIDHGC